MYVVFIHGPVASGKLTIARELSALTGLRVFHNHLTVDLALSLFPFGTPGFVALRDRVWLDSFGAAANAGQSFIFTFTPEDTVRPEFIEECTRAVADRGGAVHFVALTCPEEEIERRLGNDSRREFNKLTSVENYRRLRAAGAFEFPAMPEPLLTIATDAVSPQEAAARIQAALSHRS